ncbi:hypothetical protein Acsp02_65830 [Actinoplanes sp. NBRC 103695]|nr:hypothetical protein Acsp02_65830 [Actinoplanes sp. NBRC 103695]
MVWRAHDKLLGRAVAVKVLSPDTANRPELLDRIRGEARATMRLRFRHVGEVYDFGETEAGLPFVVTELVDGRSLAALLGEGALPYRTAVTVGAQVAAALAAAHARGIVHRKVKPGNVMVAADRVKVVDFGISAADGDPATDVRDFGLLLRQILTAPDGAALPAGVADLIERCLSEQPGARPTAAEASGTLAAAAGLFAALPQQLPSAGPAGPAAISPAAATPASTGPAATTVAAIALAAITPSAAAAHRRRRFIRRRPRGPVLVAGVAAAVGALVGVSWCVVRMVPPPAVTSAAVAPPAAAPPAAAAATCTVAYAIRDAVDGRFSATVLIALTGPARRWSLSFDLPDGQRLVKGWSEGWTQDGNSLRLSGTGGALSSGFEASFHEVTALPRVFDVDGTVCAAQTSVAEHAATEPAVEDAITEDAITEYPEPDSSEDRIKGPPPRPALRSPATPPRAAPHEPRRPEPGPKKF